jgi:hypothetical protein
MANELQEELINKMFLVVGKNLTFVFIISPSQELHEVLA